MTAATVKRADQLEQAIREIDDLRLLVAEQATQLDRRSQKIQSLERSLEALQAQARQARTLVAISNEHTRQALDPLPAGG